MSGSEAFGGGYVKIRLRTESKSLPITRRNLRLQITVKVLLWPLKVPRTVRPASAFISSLRGRTAVLTQLWASF